MSSSNQEQHMTQPESVIAPQSQKGIPKFAKSSTRKLKDWIKSHAENPYPTDQEKEVLSSQTGLSVRQISRWFVNARRRGTVPLPDNGATSSSPASIPIERPSQGTEWANMNPLDRWRNSPPDQEPAPISAIVQAVAATSNDPSDYNSEEYGLSGDDDTGILPRNARSVSSFGTSNSFGSSDSSISGSSAYSHTSNRSLNDLSSRLRRRRRRRSSSRQASPRNKSQAEKKKARIFQCTFCTDAFASKYDWMRHEGTLHLPLESWVCCQFGAVYKDPNEDFERCVFCDATHPDASHLELHAARQCIEKPASMRTFSRKDHLRQHLRHLHGVQEVLPSMTRWKTKITQVVSRCGFCDERFTLWQDRNDHLADHFQSGAQIKDWKGDRGFDSDIALFVENAIPPYLIATEATGMEPFSASRIGPKYVDPDAAQVIPSLWENLTATLSEFVIKSRQNGVLVTDDLLRREARLIVFGDDDPWNQTPADNAQWLDLFKRGHGLDLSWDSGLNPGFVRQEGYGVPSLPWIFQTPECLADFRTGSCMSPFVPPVPKTSEGLSQSTEPPQTSRLVVLQTPECLSQSREKDQTSSLPSKLQTPECLASRKASNQPVVELPSVLQTPECLSQRRQQSQANSSAPIPDPESGTSPSNPEDGYSVTPVTGQSDQDSELSNPPDLNAILDKDHNMESPGDTYFEGVDIGSFIDENMRPFYEHQT